MIYNLSRYEKKRELGSGHFGTVYEYIDKETKTKVAIKQIKKTSLRKNDYFTKAFEREIDMMATLSSNKYCVKLIATIETTNTVNIVMELCDGDLESLIKIKKGFSIEEIRKMLIQLNEVFYEMYIQKIMHRDLKLKNILYKYTDNLNKKEFDVKLADFGFAKVLENDITFTHVGTPLNMAPEILDRKTSYSFNSDLWSIGVIIYQLYSNEYPFVNNSKKGLLEKIRQEKLRKLPNDPLLKNLIQGLLTPDPKKRITWDEYFNHEFFRKTVSLNKNENLLNKETKEENKRTEFENISTSIYGKGVIEQVNEDIREKNKGDDDVEQIKLFRTKYKTVSEMEFGFKSPDLKLLYSINECDNKTYLIKEYSNDIFNKYSNQFFKDLQLSRSLSSNTCTLHYRDHFQTKKYVYVIYEYIENIVPLPIYIKEHSLTEEQIKKATVELLDKLFINAEQNHFHFDIITEYSFFFIPNQNKLILCDFGFLKYALDTKESSLFFTKHEINHINNKTNVFNFGISIYNTFFKTKIDSQTMNKSISTPQGIKFSKEFGNFLSKLLTKNPNTRTDWKTLRQHSFLNEKHAITNQVIFTKENILKIFDISQKKYNTLISALLKIPHKYLNKIINKEFIMFLQLINLEITLSKKTAEKLKNYSLQTKFNKDEEICLFQLKTGLQYPSNFYAININFEQISCTKTNLISHEKIANDLQNFEENMKSTQSKLEKFIKTSNRNIKYFPPQNLKKFTEDIVNAFRSQKLVNIVNILCNFGNENYYLIAKSIDELIIVIRNLAINKVEPVTDGDTIQKFFTQENQNIFVSFLGGMFKMYFKDRGTFDHSGEDKINRLNGNYENVLTQSLIKICTSNMIDVIEHYLTLSTCINEK